jgi:nicotinate-nucleotide--dimethylbenzimidazole phosphoribosyltransferase
VVFAGDHGIALEPVSAYPREVTYQMVLNFLAGGAAINVFAKQHGIGLKVVNAGVDHDFESQASLLNVPVAKGTKNFLHEPAMSAEECAKAIEQGAAIVRELHETGTNVIGFGEMGIGNTSSAAMIMHYICGLPIESCVGHGTGLDDSQLATKLEILGKAKARHGALDDPLAILATFGGFETAMMTGAYLQAAELGMTILVDGFIATSALLVAHRLEPAVLDYCIFSHQSDEQGHKLMLQHLQARPLMQLGLRLGEGTGAAIAYPLVVSSATFLNQMASFEAAHVSDKA